VLWKRATGRAAFFTLVGGTTLCLTLGALDFYNKPLLLSLFNAVLPWHFEAPPHFLYLSFALFVLCLLSVVILSWLTRTAPEEEALPSLGAAYTKLGAQVRWLFAGWAALAAVMVVLYVGFEKLSDRPPVAATAKWQHKNQIINANGSPER
jgi:solute:Na+ symporter, SSS family